MSGRRGRRQLQAGLSAPRRPRRPLTAYQAARIRRRACGDKIAHASRRAGYRHIAALILDRGPGAAEGRTVYRCPFRAPGAPWHYHVGRPPDLIGLARIAAAIRFGPLPDAVQHPRTGEWSRVDPFTGASMGGCPPPSPPP